MKMHALTLTALLLAANAPAHALSGNGSSGIGSAKTPIVDDVYVTLKKKFRRTETAIVRKSDNQMVLSLAALSAEQAAARTPGFTPALLGAVGAWEYIPHRTQDSREPNSWIICGGSGACVHAEAGREAGHDAATLIGSLAK